MQKKRAISLIVLVITIIVMIVLAGAIILTLNNSGIITKAEDAVKSTNLAQVKQFVQLKWSEAYADGARTEAELEAKMAESLKEMDLTAYDIDITESGVTVAVKDTSEATGNTLGTLITSASDYGKTIDYSVTVGEKIYSNWQVLYEDTANGNVFLMLQDNREIKGLSTTITSITSQQENLYNIFKLGEAGYTLNFDNQNSKMVADLIVNYGAFANVDDYGDNVVGAIGAPTLELLIAVSTARTGRQHTLTTDDYGYLIDGEPNLSLSLDGFFNSAELGVDAYAWVASPSTTGTSSGAWTMMYVNDKAINGGYLVTDEAFAICPVVCLKSSTPATLGTTTDFSLVK